MSNKKIRQLLNARVNKFSVGIAPPAVFLVEGAVRLSADGEVVKGHAAALADELSRRAQERVDGYIKQHGQQLQRFRVRESLAGLPTGHCLPGNMELFRKLVLGQRVFGPE